MAILLLKSILGFLWMLARPTDCRCFWWPTAVEEEEDVEVRGVPPQKQLEETTALVAGPPLSAAGQTHTLHSLLGTLKQVIKGTDYTAHDVDLVLRELAKWRPRREEYAPFVRWDPECPARYTRSLVYGDANMDVLLMCWPVGGTSSIHCHNNSSCWVRAVEGTVTELRYALPDISGVQGADHAGDSVGQCGSLEVISVTRLGIGSGLPQVTYINNTHGIHSVENRTDQPALSLHVYAPGLRRMRLFKPTGEVVLNVVDPK